MNISYIIVGNKTPSINKLNVILKKYNFLKLYGIANNKQDALNLVYRKRPDFIFLDIDMPIKVGLKLASDIKTFNENIQLIFITNYKQYAVIAFEIGVLDYIVKPFNPYRINLSIKRLYKKLENTYTNEVLFNKALKNLNNIKNTQAKIPCQSHGKITLVPLDDIFFCYTQKDKICIKTYTNKYLSNCTMDKLQLKSNFFRSHRSYLVNLNNVKELFSWFNGTYKIVMNDNELSELPISRSNVKKLKNLLKL